MAITAGEKNYYTFVKGIVTEASELTFPEHASIDEANFVLNKDGSRRRRLGMSYETNATVIDSGNALSSATASYVWENVGDDPLVRFGVVQVGNKLWFVDLFKASLSSNLRNGGNPLLVATDGTHPIQMTAINGGLIVVGKDFSPLLLTYNVSTDTISSSPISIQVRDLWGVDDGMWVGEEPATLSSAHKYNLLNQGWEDYYRDNYFAGFSRYPSNRQNIAMGREGTYVFNRTWVSRNAGYLGNTPTAKGRIIIDAFARGVSRNYQSSGNPADTENGKITTVASFAGRVFYSGITSSVTQGDSYSPNYTGFVFFSKLVENAEDIHKCYQDADPTNPDVYDLIATDGGYLTIAEAANIVKLEATGLSLVVFASNGVWEITGDADAGFSATSYKIRKITNVGCVSGTSVVNAEGNIVYWTRGGIYIIQPDEVSGTLVAQNISVASIQTLYDRISGPAKEYAVGTYDAAAKTITWLYNDDDNYEGGSYYNTELVFDVVLAAFYKNTVAIGDIALSGYMPTPDFNVDSYEEQVVVGGVGVVAGVVVGGLIVDYKDVVIPVRVKSGGRSGVKYLTTIKDGTLHFTFSSYSNSSFLDWEEFYEEGVDYSSFLVTGFEIAESAARHKQAPFIVFHLRRTETGFDAENNAIGGSSCLVTPYWDFADHINSGKIAQQFQAYRLLRNFISGGESSTFDYGQSVITTKSKVRGRGRALSLRIESETGKDMHILGWSALYTMGTRL